MKNSCGLGCAVLLLVVANVSAGGDDKIKESARAVLAKYQDAIVLVRVEGTVRIVEDGKAGEKEEFSVELAGVVVTKDGLTLVSGRPTGLQWDFAPSEVGGKVEREYKQINLVLRNGKKLPAELLLRDNVLGVAFFAPTKKHDSLCHVEFTKVPMPAILDDAIVVQRLAAEYDNEAEVAIAPVTAVLKEKQSFRVCGGEGSAVFDAKGRPLGLSVTRWSKQDMGSVSYPWIMTHDALQPAIERAKMKWKAGK